MSSRVVALLAAAVLLLGYFAYQRWLSEPTMDSVVDMIAELNAKLPAMADPATRLERITLDENDILYRFVLVDNAAATVNGEHLALLMTPQVRKAVCGAPMLQTVLKHGLLVRHEYHAKDGRRIAEVVVKPSDCGLSSIADD